MPVGQARQAEGGRARHPLPDAAPGSQRCGIHVLPRQRCVQVRSEHTLSFFLYARERKDQFFR